MRGWRLEAGLVVLLLVLSVLSLMVGPAGLSPAAALKGLFEGDGVAGIIVRDIRLPRTLLALLIGATLGLSGAALQGLLRNPLAEPALFGAPQAAAAGASFMIAYGFAGATSFAVLLAGLALASFAGAATALILNFAPNPYAALEITFWLLGSLEDRSFQHIAIAAPFFALSWLLLVLNLKAYRALTLGEDAAQSLGVDVDRTRLTVVIGVALGVGAAVAVAGSIGFIGLVAPHLVRRRVDSDPARVCLPATLTGAALLMAADIAVRVVPTTPSAVALELKVGVVTALIGVPFFLAMIFSERRQLEGAPS
jgi:iron complex transport system permease protein